MNNRNCFSLTLLCVLCALNAWTKPGVPRNLVTIRQVKWVAATPEGVDMKVFIGDFLLVKKPGLKPGLAKINVSFRVQSRFRSPLRFEFYTQSSSVPAIPGYVADWDDGSAKMPYCSVNMSWGFSGELKCGNLRIRVTSKPEPKGKADRRHGEE